MNLSLDSAKKETTTNVLPVPKALNKYIAPWANIKYDEYDFGKVLLQEWTSHKFSIFIWHHFIEKEIDLQLDFDKPSIVLQFIIAGKTSWHYPGVKQSHSHLLDPVDRIMYFPRGKTRIIFHQGHHEIINIEIDKDYLQNTAGDYPGIDKLIECVQLSSKKVLILNTASINYISKAILKNLRLCEEDGTNLKLEMQKYIIELLSEYFRATGEWERDQKLVTVPNKESLIKMKNSILIAPDIHVQTLENMSKQFGISLTSLKLNFKVLFGYSLGVFVRMHALNKARYLVETTTRSIDDISDEIGYIYRANFNQAFKKQFGFSAAALRNKSARDKI
jgi:AraC-like DNA-binding protein